MSCWNRWMACMRSGSLSKYVSSLPIDGTPIAAGQRVKEVLSRNPPRSRRTVSSWSGPFEKTILPTLNSCRSGWWKHQSPSIGRHLKSGRRLRIATCYPDWHAVRRLIRSRKEAEMCRSLRFEAIGHRLMPNQLADLNKLLFKLNLKVHIIEFDLVYSGPLPMLIGISAFS